MAVGFGLFCLAVLGAGIFVLAKGISSALDAAVVLIFNRRPPATALRLASAACTLCLLVLLPMRGYSHLQLEMYRKAIPPQFELRQVIYRDDFPDFRYGCDAAIFRLSDESIARIQRGGLSNLESARLGRNGTADQQYQPWKATPAAKGEKLFRGAHCAKHAPDLLRHATHFADKEGAFFTIGPAQDLVIIPSLGVLILSYGSSGAAP